MFGKILTTPYYTRKDIQANSKQIYVFGDNMARRGLGGQAKEARGEVNSIGIPTKWFPSMEENAFFSDTDYNFVAPVIRGEFKKISQYLFSGYTVIWPADGVGTGLSELETRAPQIFDLIEDCYKGLRNGVF